MLSGDQPSSNSSVARTVPHTVQRRVPLEGLKTAQIYRESLQQIQGKCLFWILTTPLINLHPPDGSLQPWEASLAFSSGPFLFRAPSLLVQMSVVDNLRPITVVTVVSRSLLQKEGTDVLLGELLRGDLRGWGLWKLVVLTGIFSSGSPCIPPPRVLQWIL